MKRGTYRTTQFFLLAIALLAVNIIASAQSQDGPVAIVNGKPITLKQVDNLLLSRLFPLQQQIYAIRKAALENLVLRALLADQAKKEGKAIEQVQRSLTAGNVEVSDTQVEAIYADNISAFGAMSGDEAKQRIRLDLESQRRMNNYREALLRLRREAVLEVFLAAPRLPDIDVAGNPFLGLTKAPVTVIEFADFECSFCKESQDHLKQVLSNYKEQVQLVFKHLPLPGHADAVGAARAAFCAQRQNKFWEYHDRLFMADNVLSETISRVASEIGLDIEAFERCVTSEESNSAVNRDIREAKRLGIERTPTFVINGRPFGGLLTVDEFKAALDEELKLHATRVRNKQPLSSQ